MSSARLASRPGLSQAGPAQRDQRHSAHLVQAAGGHGRAQLGEPGPHAHVRAQLAAGAQRAGQPGLVVGEAGHDDPADPLRPDQSGQVGYGGVAGDAQPQLRMLAQQPGQRRAGWAGASQYRPLGQPAPAVRRAQRRGPGRPGRDQGRRGDHHQPEHLHRVRRPGQQQQPGQRRRGRDPARLIAGSQADPQPVQPGGVQPGQHDRGVPGQQPAGKPAEQQRGARDGGDRQQVGQRQPGRGHQRARARRSPARRGSPGIGRPERDHLIRHAHRGAPTVRSVRRPAPADSRRDTVRAA